MRSSMKRYQRILGFVCIALAVLLFLIDPYKVSFLVGRGEAVNGAAIFLGALGVILLGVSSRR